MTAWPTPTPITLGREVFAVYDYGPPTGESNGDIVLLHGMADVARSLEPLALSLIDRYRVLAFDARGHGQSTHPGAYSVLHYVADLADLIEALELVRPILIGHSLGGHTVANYAGLYPDLVRAVALLEGLGPPTLPPPTAAEHQLDQARANVGLFRSSSRHRVQPDIAAAAARLTATHARLDPDRALLLAEEGTKPGPDGGRVWRHDERTRHWVASLEHRALENRWAAITAPVLAVTGADAWEVWWARPGGPAADRVPLTDEQAAARIDHFTDIEHIELADAGHMVHFDQPERLNQIVNDFLKRRVEND